MSNINGISVVTWKLLPSCQAFRLVHKLLLFFCEWDSRDRELHYVTNVLPQRKSLEPEKKNVQHPHFVDPQKILLPPLHIKLGLMNNFVKALDKTKTGFKCLYEKFPRRSEAKIKEEVFVGPQISELLRVGNFDHLLHGKEKKAQKAFRSVATEFLGNCKADNYNPLVANLLKSYKSLGCNMSLKIPFLQSHLDFFALNCGDVSNEPEERFHQDIAAMEKRCQGKWNPSMLADYCWNVVRDDPAAEYKRQAKKRRSDTE